ncbi:hypothetical protein UlMin_005703 [Ulmus minor]
MGSEFVQPHFVLIPLMAQGHTIPMVDMAKLLAKHGVIVTIVTTPQNAVWFNTTIDQSTKSGLDIRLLQLRFPSAEAGLPEGCENLDTLSSRKLTRNFFQEAKMLQKPLESFLSEAQPRPGCIISDIYLAWTFDVACNIQIPRLVFDGMSCFNMIFLYKISFSKIYEKISLFKPFVVPGLPHQIALTKSQLPETFNPGPLFMKDLHEEVDAVEEASYGMVFNTFEELEPKYVKASRKVIKNDKVWCVGSVSLCNKDNFEKAQSIRVLGI